MEFHKGLQRCSPEKISKSLMSTCFTSFTLASYLSVCDRLATQRGKRNTMEQTHMVSDCQIFELKYFPSYLQAHPTIQELQSKVLACVIGRWQRHLALCGLDLPTHSCRRAGRATLPGPLVRWSPAERRTFQAQLEDWAMSRRKMKRWHPLLRACAIL